MLRQIHGNKASRTQRAEIAYLIVTVVVATVVTVLGFAGPSKLAPFLRKELIPGMENTTILEMLFNLAVLLILVLTLLGLIYRYGERANRHFRSVEVLTEFIRDWEDAVALHDAGVATLDHHDLALAGERYKGILGALPPNTDREYRKAKDDAKKKKEHEAGRDRRLPLRLRGELSFGSSSDSSPLHASELAMILQYDTTRLAALQTVSAILGPEYWIVGSFVREAVWDSKQGFKTFSPLREIDVIYFDPHDLRGSSEQMTRERLARVANNLDWSIKNQARMHIPNGHAPYADIAEAISRAPETASTVAVQLDRGTLRVLAPMGLTDLMEMRLRLNPRGDPKVFMRRVTKVERNGRWPGLKIHLPQERTFAHKILGRLRTRQR
ncbi:nucleotidyltransferase family protein [Microbacterium sp. UFMG61]|uniref:nucleotidyltransferase family protein n=1 Tax=Microbacterium sp. UFMG61 TaxID=2745935 RepID=UPI00188E0007|nr:nucleotidyltransferase family protein [Microbacterium sp. UFMG61]